MPRKYNIIYLKFIQRRSITSNIVLSQALDALNFNIKKWFKIVLNNDVFLLDFGRLS